MEIIKRELRYFILFSGIPFLIGLLFETRTISDNRDIGVAILNIALFSYPATVVFRIIMWAFKKN